MRPTHRIATTSIALALLLPHLPSCATGGPERPSIETDTRQVSRQLNTFINTQITGTAIELTEEWYWVGAPVAAPPAETWSHLEAVYDSLGIPVNARDSGAMLVGNRGYMPRRIGGQRLSAYLDCGYGVTAQPYADVHDVGMTIQTRVSEADGDGSYVETVIVAKADPRAHRANPVKCSTKSELEKEIVWRLRLATRRPPGGGGSGG